MSNLVIPNKYNHKYVVGIDFGHGETSAAICELEWDKDAGQRQNQAIDLDMDRKARKKVIPSAICRVKGEIFIGDEAFEHITDNEGIRVCFKQRPQSLDGKAEQLMIDYMRAIYARIREDEDRLTDTNHIVYIARPSGWQDEEAKELYRQMAIKAGIPLGGLTSESRAAIFYARSPYVNFANEIAKGAIVFDLGSSTVDFTYLSDNDNPIDYGDNFGASIIDDIIYREMILKTDEMKEFICAYPEYEGMLKFKARKFKEAAYSRSDTSKTTDSFDLDQIILSSEDAYDKYGDVHVKLKIQNLEELNSLIEEKEHYITKLRHALVEFCYDKIDGRIINGVFLTGGASRMNFIHSMIAEALNLPPDKVKYDMDNPSLTISRGIALIGAADALTYVLVEKLKESIPEFFTDDLFKSLVEGLSSNVSEAVWNVINSTITVWIKDGETTNLNDLRKMIDEKLKLFQNNTLGNIVDTNIQTFIKDKSENIRKEMNKIISQYAAPEQEITVSSDISIGNHQAITESLRELTEDINNISTSMGHIVAEIMWKALGIFLWGALVIPYYLLKSFLTSDESKRRDKAKIILEKKNDIISQINESICSNLQSNTTFKTEMTKTLNDYFNTLIDDNLQKVRIPIE